MPGGKCWMKVFDLDADSTGPGSTIPGMLNAARTLLRQTFGFADFHPQQAEVIAAILAGHDALVLMPTGGGKSLCYQIPSMLLDGTGIVVSPLIALMQNQVLALRQAGVQAEYLNSSLDYGQQQAIEMRLRSGQLDLLYIAPERLLLPRTLELLGQLKLALFAIDEAHCVSSWGHDFRPEYLQLSVLQERFLGVPRMALTATADATTRRDIVAQLGLQQAAHYISSFDRPNIRYLVEEQQAGREQLLRFLDQHHPDDSGIVYCLSRKKVEATAQWLNLHGRQALPYHAGLLHAERDQNQVRFMNEAGLIMVATIAFGMGIDKPDIRFVAHLDLPRSLEAYYQETGRAGRDGLPASAWLCYGLQNVVRLRQMLEASEADEAHKRLERRKLEAMLGYCEMIRCRRQALLAYFGEQKSQPCGNCDCCLYPPRVEDGSVYASKALSCVYRSGQRFGAGYIIDLLLGKTSGRILARGHQQLSTFGIGTELTALQWRSVFRQLLAGGLLSTDPEGFGVLRLTEACRPILQGQQPLQLRLEQPDRKKAAPRRSKILQRPALTGVDEQLWQSLCQCRTQLARQYGVPPYLIFHDSTLHAMVEERPADLNQFSCLSGVGQHKLEHYGAIFLQILQTHSSPLFSGD